MTQHSYYSFSLLRLANLRHATHQLIELCRRGHKGQIDIANGAGTVLRHDHAGNTLIRSVIARRLVLVARTIEEHDDVGVLLDGARFTQVGKLRALTGTAFHGTEESWESEMTGIARSFAKIFKARLISDTSTARLSARLPGGGLTSCK